MIVSISSPPHSTMESHIGMTQRMDVFYPNPPSIYQKKESTPPSMNAAQAYETEYGKQIDCGDLVGDTYRSRMYHADAVQSKRVVPHKGAYFGHHFGKYSLPYYRITSEGTRESYDQPGDEEYYRKRCQSWGRPRIAPYNHVAPYAVEKGRVVNPPRFFNRIVNSTTCLPSELGYILPSCREGGVNAPAYLQNQSARALAAKGQLPSGGRPTDPISENFIAENAHRNTLKSTSVIPGLGRHWMAQDCLDGQVELDPFDQGVQEQTMNRSRKLREETAQFPMQYKDRPAVNTAMPHQHLDINLANRTKRGRLHWTRKQPQGFAAFNDKHQYSEHFADMADELIASEQPTSRARDVSNAPPQSIQTTTVRRPFQHALKSSSRLVPMRAI